MGSEDFSKRVAFGNISIFRLAGAQLPRVQTKGVHRPQAKLEINKKREMTQKTCLKNIFFSKLKPP